MSMTVRTFAQLCEVDERTVQRWLKAGRLPGATKTNRGWVIPADAKAPAQDDEPTAPTAPTRAVVAPVAQRAVQGASLSEALATLPAFLPLEVAALLLGVPVARIKENPERFEAEPLDAFRRLVVPARVVREIAGL